MDRRACGMTGEDAAARYLRSRGFRILARRWRTRFGEIDLVTSKGDEIVFVEVKTRRSGSFGVPQAAVDRWKRERLRRVCYAFLERHNIIPQRPFRIDVIAVTLGSGGRPDRLTHIRYAVSEDD
ncbi:hypothetical protein AMJ57_00400 [Parcubacteria bacterium SG8_24]|nr:MAG: hypothetical protein AMJ57_00400 [Parcubacteria bacterium SG8_24]